MAGFHPAASSCPGLSVDRIRLIYSPGFTVCEGIAVLRRASMRCTRISFKLSKIFSWLAAASSRFLFSSI